MSRLSSGQLRKWNENDIIFLLVKVYTSTPNDWWWQCLQDGIIMWWNKEDIERNSTLL